MWHFQSSFIFICFQILITVKPGLSNHSGGIQVELSEIESRMEEYPVTRGFLTFLSQLTDTPVPAALGAGLRAPGFEPYLQYVVDDVFLRFGTRAYKNSAEKVTDLSFVFIFFLLSSHQVVINL